MSDIYAIVQIICMTVALFVAFALGFVLGRKQEAGNHIDRGLLQRPKDADHMTGFIVWCEASKDYHIVGDDGSRLPLDGTRFPVEQYPWLASTLLDEYGPYAQAGMGYVRVPDWRNEREKARAQR